MSASGDLGILEVLHGGDSVFIVIIYYCYIVLLLYFIFIGRGVIPRSCVCFPFWFFSVEQININRHSNQQLTP